MLIEDSRIIRERLLETLAQISNTSVVAATETETEAVTLLERVAWNIAILDLQLKEGSGLGVLKQLPKARRPAASKIIVFTNFGFPQYREKCLAMGADYFFDKSREFESMRQKVVDLAETGFDTRH